jgi:hypothetical protein
MTRMREFVERRFKNDVPWWLDCNYDYVDFWLAASVLAFLITVFFALRSLP